MENVFITGDSKFRFGADGLKEDAPTYWRTEAFVPVRTRTMTIMSMPVFNSLSLDRVIQKVCIIRTVQKSEYQGGIAVIIDEP